MNDDENDIITGHIYTMTNPYADLPDRPQTKGLRTVWPDWDAVITGGTISIGHGTPSQWITSYDPYQDLRNEIELLKTQNEELSNRLSKLESYVRNDMVAPQTLGLRTRQKQYSKLTVDDLNNLFN